MTYSVKRYALSDVCEVQMGYTARTRLEPTPAIGVPVIQLGDLRGDEDFDPSKAPLYALGPSFERYWARAGDVLFRSRGERNTAVAIEGDTNSAAIAVLPLIVLRPKPTLISGKYLAWCINQSASQQYFDRCARGTRLRMVPKTCLDELEVHVPDLATQKIIVEIDSLARRECALMHQLADKKLALTSFALLRQMRNAQPHGNGAGQSGARCRQGQSGKSERTNS
ncbi:MAG: restriction endonuclease subunit S [Rhodospirillaceae bacterium]|nr:restriction endonuclease subunit S [Rhodospirillaceae bacterium]